MTDQRSESIRELVEYQRGVISRRQAIERGMSGDAVDRLVRADRWQPLYRGVYATFTGEPSRVAQLWAAVLLGGPGAALSHHSAAEVSGLADRSSAARSSAARSSAARSRAIQTSAAIHVTIPEGRRRAAHQGIVFHRSGRIEEAIHPVLAPARTRIEETVFDLAQQATTFDDAFAVACAATQRGLTTVSLLAVALAKRKQQRWRHELNEAFGHIADGAHSLLEYRYVRLVEAPHGLPQARRQAKVSTDGRSRYLDNLYDDFGLLVELDGQQAHPEHQRWHDLRRINSMTAHGITTLRYGWTDVVSNPCRTATEISAVLRSLGWRGRLRRCKRDCQLP